MNMENAIPRLNLTSVSHQQALNVLAVQPASEFIPRPPAAAPKISHTPSLRQSHTVLVPQLTPAMIGKTSDGSELPYKKILRGRLGVRSHCETRLKSSNPGEPLGSQTFRSTMEVLNSRCGSSSARASKSASSSEMNRVSESASSWYERRSQALSAFSAPSFGFCATAADEPNRTDEKISSNLQRRPQSSVQPKLSHPWTGASNDHARRPTTSAVQCSRHKQQLGSDSEANSSKQVLGPSPIINADGKVLSGSSAIATQTSAASIDKGKIRERKESFFLFPSENPHSPSIGMPGDSISASNPTLEQATSELIKGRALKKFSHASQRVAIRVMRVNSNAELIIDNELQDRVVAIFDGLSSYVQPKQSLHSQDDFVPKYNFNPTRAFHILLMNEEFVDVIADSAWIKECWMSGIRLMLAQMKSKFQPLPVRLPDFDTNDLTEELVRRTKWLEFLRASTDRLEDERKRKDAMLHALELKEKETSAMYDEIMKPVGLQRISDLNSCVARMEFLNIQLDQGGITLKHQETEQSSTTQVCKAHLQEMSSIVADANSYVQFIRSQWTEAVQQTRRLETERNCFKDFCFRNRKQIIDRLKHRRMFHEQIKSELDVMTSVEKNRGAAILERSRKSETFIDDRQKRHLVANVSLLSFFQGGIDSSLASSFPRSSYIDNQEPKSFLLLKGSFVPASQPPRGNHLTLKSGFEWMMVTAGMEDLSAFVQRIVAQNAVGVALRAASEASLSGRELKIENLNAALSEFSLVHSASESNPADDVPDISKLISSSVTRIRDLEIALRWHQRKETLLMGYSKDVRIALENIVQRICCAVALNSESKPPNFSPDSRSRSKLVKRQTETSNEPLITLLFLKLMNLYDPLLSLLNSNSIEGPLNSDELVALTLHNTRVEITDAVGFPELQSADHVDPVVAPVMAATASDGSLNVQTAKPKTPGGLVPTLPSVQHFKYRKSEAKKFKIPRMFEHLEWEKNEVADSSSAAIGLYDKNGRRVRIARKQVKLQFVDEIEHDSSDDSAGVTDFDTCKVVSKRFIKEQARRVFQENALTQAFDATLASN